MGVAVSFNVQYWVDGDGWVTITSDTVAVEGLRLSYGITGNGPMDVCASVGTLEFTLNNAANNSGGVQGYYSPLHANQRANWDYGRLVRVVFTYSATDYVKFYGKLVSIDPEPGTYRGQRVAVRAEDGIADMLHASVRKMGLQTDKYEDDLIDTVISSMPDDSRPPAWTLDEGLDFTSYAFDQLSGNMWALPIIRDLVQSSNGLFVIEGSGTARYINRVNRSTATSAITLTNTMHGLETATSLQGLFNRVRVTIHPKSISAAATEELYASPETAVILVPYGETVELFVDYTDPNDRETKVGGASVVTAVVEGTHYHAYYPDLYLPGGGNPTATITVTLTAFASTAKWSFQNTSALGLPVEVRDLVIIGKVLRDLGEESYEAASSQYYGERALAIDLPFQQSATTARHMAQWIADQYSVLAEQTSAVEFIANDSSANMTAALAVEPGDAITLTETVTGLSSVKCLVHSVSLDVTEGPWVRCRWGLAPGEPWSMWSLGTSGYTELGQTTTLGF